MFYRFFNKILILANSLIGYIIKFKIDIFGIGKINTLDINSDIVISLTSYGRRVEYVVFYTIISILKQKHMPSRIILWLDDSYISHNTIPDKLIRLKKYGLEIRYCSDYKSYKKLIPTLYLCPDKVIITVDDDIYYNRNLISDLYSAYNVDHSKVHCLRAAIPTFSFSGKINSYNTWADPIFKTNYKYLLPIGCGGILYPPGVLHKDVLNDKLFMSLAPCADDIWFWIMAIINNTKHSISKKTGEDYSFDAIYQYFHKGSALTHSNSKLSHNDIQLKKILEYYHLNL